MNYFREILAVGILALWSFMVWENPHAPLIVGAMIGLMTGSVAGFYFGSTKTGAETATKNADAVTQAAMASPQAVEIVNDATKPVPVEGQS